METLSFAFGVLTVIAIALVVVVVIGVVKVIKMQKEIGYIRNEVNHTRDYTNQLITAECGTLHRVIEDDRRELGSRIDEVYRYTDSRFDKFENRLNARFESAREVLETTKGILND